MLKRLLLAVALPVLAAAPVHAQTTFFASGGDVVFTPSGLSFTPFQFFADYLGLHRLIASSDGTSFTLDTRGSVAISSFNTLGPLTIGNFAPGTSIFFTYAVNGRSYTGDDFYRERVGGYDLQYADITNNNSDRIDFQLRGVTSAAAGLQCPGATELSTCSRLTTTTSTPEPGTIALFATGLAGLIPVAIRRRREAQR